MSGIGSLSHFIAVFVVQMIDGVLCLFASNTLFVFSCGLSAGAKACPLENKKTTEYIFVLFHQIPHNAFFSFPSLWFSLQMNTVVQDAPGISWDTQVHLPLFVYLYKWIHPKDMELSGDHMSNGVQQI